MYHIDIMTLFPDTVGDVLSESILGRAQERDQDALPDLCSHHQPHFLWGSIQARRQPAAQAGELLVPANHRTL